jgi:hypothetical protein
VVCLTIWLITLCRVESGADRGSAQPNHPFFPKEIAMSRTSYWTIAFATLFTVAAGTRGASIAVNFVNTAETDGTPNNYLAPSDTAGVVSQAYWTSLIVTDPDDGNGTGSITNAVNDSGTATTLDVSLGPLDYGSGEKTYPTGFGGNYNWGSQNTGDAEMHAGGVNFSPLIVLSQIPYASYDVYLYMQGGSNGGNAGGTASLAVGAGGSGTVDTTVFYYHGYTGAYSPPYYFQVTSTDSGNPGSGNYFLWQNCTADTLDVSFEANGAIYDAGTVGIQIVETPEPASLALLALGGLVLLPSRKRLRM